MFSTLIVGDALGASNTISKAFLLVGPVLVLEPILVAFTGGTVGHHLMGVRITRLDGSGNIGILAATVRFVVKLLLGWLSFIFVLTTKKHQAVHDVIARSLVVHKNPTGLPEYEVLSERSIETEGYVQAPIWRRTSVVIAYCLFLFIAFSIAITFVSSAGCVRARVCTTADALVRLVLSVLWLASTGWVIVQGWKGAIFGCRRRPR